MKAISDKRLLHENIEKSKDTQLLDERALAYTKHQELYDELSDRGTTILSLEDTILDKQSEIIALEADLSLNTPWVIDTIAHRSGGKTWPSFVIELILEFLAHRTPPSNIAPNILSVASATFPNKNIVKQLPSLRFIQQMHTVLLHVTKTLAAFQLAGVSHFSQMFTDTDGTSRRKTSFENLVVG